MFNVQGARAGGAAEARRLSLAVGCSQSVSLPSSLSIADAAAAAARERITGSPSLNLATVPRYGTAGRRSLTTVPRLPASFID